MLIKNLIVITKDELTMETDIHAFTHVEDIDMTIDGLRFHGFAAGDRTGRNHTFRNTEIHTITMTRD